MSHHSSVRGAPVISECGATVSLPWKEADRLAALQGFDVSNITPEAAFDGIARIAAQVCQTPIALISVNDEERERFKAEIGLELRETPGTISICAHALHQPGLFVVPDTLDDPRFAETPLVTGDPSVRFYAGVRLETDKGLPLGMLCVFDRSPRPGGLTNEQAASLLTLARAVTSQLELKRLNKALAGSEKHFRTLANAIPQMVWSTGPDGKDDYFNQRWYEFIGLPSSSTDRTWISVLHPDDRERAWRRWQHSLQSGDDYECELRLLHYSGEYRWVLTRAVPVRNEQDQIERWFGTTTDIDDRKKAEAAHEAGEEQYRALVEASSAMVWHAAPDGSIIGGSSGWEAFCGQGREQYLGYGWLDTVHPDDRERIRSVWEGVLASNHPATGEYRARHVNGEYRWVLAKSVPLLDPDGTVRVWVGTLTDIHEQKLAAERLSQSEERYRALINASSSVVWQASSDGSISEDLGWSGLSAQGPDECAGESWLASVHPEDQDMVRAAWAHAVALGKQYELELRIQHKDGRYRWCLVRAVPLKGSNGVVREWVGTLTDTHDRKQTEDALRTSEERLRLAVETTATGIWDADLITGQRQWTREAREILGIPADTPITRDSFLNCVLPDDRARVEGTFFVNGPTGELDYSGTYRIIRADNGDERWITATGRTILDESGRPIRKIGTIRDVTSHKQTEIAFRDSEERLRLALQAGRMVAWEQDLTTNFVTRSQNSTGLLGIGSAPLSAILDRLHPEDRHRREHFRPKGDGTGPETIEFRYTPPDGKMIWLGLRGEWAGPNRLIGPEPSHRGHLRHHGSQSGRDRNLARRQS